MWEANHLSQIPSWKNSPCAGHPFSMPAAKFSCQQGLGLGQCKAFLCLHAFICQQPAMFKTLKLLADLKDTRKEGRKEIHRTNRMSLPHLQGLCHLSLGPCTLQIGRLAYQVRFSVLPAFARSYKSFWIIDILFCEKQRKDALAVHWCLLQWWDLPGVSQRTGTAWEVEKALGKWELCLGRPGLSRTLVGLQAFLWLPGDTLVGAALFPFLNIDCQAAERRESSCTPAR